MKRALQILFALFVLIAGGYAQAYQIRNDIFSATGGLISNTANQVPRANMQPYYNLLTEQNGIIVSGYVYDACYNPVSGATISFSNSGGSAVSNSSGFYIIGVPPGWSGTATPSKSGLTFSPAAITYPGLVTPQSNQNYIQTSNTYTISGYIRDAGSKGLFGVTVRFSGNVGNAVTDASGFYSLNVCQGWSGTATPTLGGYIFSPVSNAYSNILSHQTNQNYTGGVPAPAYKISGYTILENGYPIPNATVIISGASAPITSNADGYFETWVPAGWSGTINGSRTGFQFSGATVSPVNSDQSKIKVLADFAVKTGFGASNALKATNWCTDYASLTGKSCSQTERVIGDPIETASGAQILEYSMLSVQGVIPIVFNLAYNSLILEDGPAGKSWSFNYGFGAHPVPQSNGDIVVEWAGNRANRFNPAGSGVYTSAELACKYDRLVKNADNSYTLTRREKSVYEFDAAGRLVRLLNDKGQALTFSYNAGGKLSRITEPVSGVYLDYAYNPNGWLSVVSDPLNRQVSLIYDAAGHLTGITDVNGNTVTFSYNAAGQILIAADADGKTLFSNTFDSQGRVIAQEDSLPTNQPIRLTYDESQTGKLITSMTDRNGHSRVYTFDTKYQMLSKVDELGNTVAYYTYDDHGNRVSVTDAKGSTVWFGYDADGNMNMVRDPAGNITEMTYDGKGNMTGVKDALGRSMSFAYDSRSNLIRTTDPKGNQTVFTYNPNGQIETVTSPSGNTVSFQYSGGLPVRITQPEGNYDEMGYDGVGRLIRIADAENNAFTLTYDEACGSSCRADSMTDPLGNTVRMTYDKRGNLLTFTDAKGFVTSYEYDDNSNLIASADALNQRVAFAYDGEDRLTSVTDTKGNVTQLHYDPKGRLIKTTDALGNTQEMTYDTADNLIRQTDAYGKTVMTFAYDKLNRLTSVTDALGYTEKFEFDSVNRLTKTVDPLNRITRFQYDDLDQVVSVIDALNGEGKQSYDADGNPTAVADPNANQTMTEFDKNGRVVSETSAAGDTVSYTYNSRDLLSEFTNGRTQKRQVEYDRADRITRFTDPDGSVSFTYDQNDNLLTVSDAAGTITREYDALDRVVSYTDSFGNTIGYEYDSEDNLSRLTYPDGKQVTYAYDALDRLISVKDWAGRTTAYEYDKNSLPIKIIRPNGTMAIFTYDDAGQPVQQKDVTSGGQVIVQYDFTYDAAGDIAAENPTPQPTYDISALQAASMTYGKANRVATYNGSSVIHDADGNMIRGPLNKIIADFRFDSRNRLISAEATDYMYDAEDNRIAVTENGKTTQYVIDPEADLSQVLVRTEPDGTQTYYVYGLGLLGFERAGAYRTYHFDSRGSTVAITDENQQITHLYLYDAFGKLFDAREESFNPFRYVGEFGVMYDQNSLYYMRARYYNSDIGRFMSEDPIWNMNLYRYSDTSPISEIDPEGLFSGGVHKSITSKAVKKIFKKILGKKVNKSFINKIIKGNLYVDRFENQDNNNQHSMCDLSQSRTECEISCNTWQKKFLAEAIISTHKGNYSRARFYLGKGLHVIQDQVSHNFIPLTKHGPDIIVKDYFPENDLLKKAQKKSEEYLEEFVRRIVGYGIFDREDFNKKYVKKDKDNKKKAKNKKKKKR